MNWRTGLKRVAYGLAAVYWALALAAAWGESQDEVRRSLRPYLAAETYEFDNVSIEIALPDGRAPLVSAPDWPSAQVRAEQWAASHPYQEPLWVGAAAFLRALGYAALGFAALWLLYRGLRWVALGFVQPKAPLAS